MNEFIEQFLIECRELVEQATHDLLALEERSDDRERLDSAFRAFHTLKGAAGIVEFAAMGVALHAAEDVLAAARAGSTSMSPALVGDCLSCLDQVVQWLDAMEATGDVPADAGPAADAIVARFAALSAGPAPEPPALIPVQGPLEPTALALLRAQIDLLQDPAGEPSAGRTGSALRLAGNLLLGLGRSEEAAQLQRMLARPPEQDEAVLLLQSVIDGRLAPTAAATEPPREAPEPATRSLRVDIERVEALVNLTGELTVAKNALAHAAGLASQGADVAGMLKDQHAVLHRLVGELQRSVLHIRVLPVRQAFQRFPRLVREMVIALGKPAHLVTEGESTEADKAIVDSLFEPLLHVIRNALDHGVESAADRAAAGKPPSATLRLAASREGETVVVELADDGGGVDVDRVRQIAQQRGLVNAETLGAMSDDEMVELIFAPGFSTASEVTGLSGRGVGMDAVRSAIERLGGRVTVQSRRGVGTTVRFLLPFTVMMSRVMTVQAGGQLFGVPLEAVVETVRVPRAAIVPVGTAQAFVLRDRTIPVIDLAASLGDRPGSRTSPEAKLVVASVGGLLAGLEVDGLGERMDVMLRPMDGLLSGTPGVAGATLLGDGRVLIVLDLQGLLQ